MKIVIITVYYAVNYGSYLQAFSLQEYLKGLGHEVVFIRHFSFKYTKWRIKCLFTYNPLKWAFKAKFALGYFQDWKNFKTVSPSEKLDLVIIGSDEMWQLKNLTLKPLKLFWGNGVNSDTVVTYALCSNDTTYEDTKKYPFIANSIRNLKKISFRDEITRKAYGPYLSEEPEMCIDPTFLIDLNLYTPNKQQLGDYILVYTYGFSESMVQKVKELSQKVHLPIISAAQKFDWCDRAIPASPLGFLELIKKAKYVVTDTFHGTVLSIIFHKQFVSFASHKPKVFDILKQMGLEERNGMAYASIVDIMKTEINYIECDKIIDEKKKRSYQYINDCLRGIENE